MEPNAHEEQAIWDAGMQSPCQRVTDEDSAEKEMEKVLDAVCCRHFILEDDEATEGFSNGGDIVPFLNFLPLMPRFFLSTCLHPGHSSGFPEIPPPPPHSESSALALSHLTFTLAAVSPLPDLDPTLDRKVLQARAWS